MEMEMREVVRTLVERFFLYENTGTTTFTTTVIVEHAADFFDKTRVDLLMHPDKWKGFVKEVISNVERKREQDIIRAGVKATLAEPDLTRPTIAMHELRDRAVEVSSIIDLEENPELTLTVENVILEKYGSFIPRSSRNQTKKTVEKEHLRQIKEDVNNREYEDDAEDARGWKRPKHEMSSRLSKIQGYAYGGAVCEVIDLANRYSLGEPSHPSFP